MEITFSGQYDIRYEYDKYDGTSEYYDIGSGDRYYEEDFDIDDEYIADFFVKDLPTEEILDRHSKEIKKLYQMKGEPMPEINEDFGKHVKEFLLKDNNLEDFMELQYHDIYEDIREYLLEEGIVTDDDIENAIRGY